MEIGSGSEKIGDEDVADMIKVCVESGFFWGLVATIIRLVLKFTGSCDLRYTTTWSHRLML